MSNLEHYTDTFGKIGEAFKQCEEFIENSTPEELQAYEESLGINPDDYKSSEQEKEVLYVAIKALSADAINAIEMVRCENCIFYEKALSVQGFCHCHESIVYINDFCSYGERREP